MQGCILAAGMGRRLGELTKENTKCMVPVNGKPLIARTLSALARLGLSRTVLVVGFGREKLRKYVGDVWEGMPIVYIENEAYATTNNIISLAKASDVLIEDDTLLLESDLIFDERLLRRLVEAPEQNVACVAHYEPWMDGTMVTLDSNGMVDSFVPKVEFDYAHQERYYKTVNIYKFSPAFCRQHYIPFLTAYAQAFGQNGYYEDVLRVLAFIDQRLIKGLVLQDEPWYEIDDVHDLYIAETLFAQPSAQLTRLQAEYGGYWRYPKLLDFCYLVNPFFPTLQMTEELKASFEKLLTNYPSGQLMQSLLAGKMFGLPPELILVGNGAAELIQALMDCVPGRIGVIRPTFEEYAHRVTQTVVPWVSPHPGFRYTAQDVLEHFCQGQVDALVLINPDNPSGNLISQEGIEEIATACDRQNIRLILDESFIDFADAPFSCLMRTFLDRHPQAVVVKSISKSYGVPGLRLGVLASADMALLAKLRKALPIWNINSFGEYFLQIMGKYEKAYRRAQQQFVAVRQRFEARLRAIRSVTVFPTQANYFLLSLPDSLKASEIVKALLQQAHILIKDCSTKPGFEGHQMVRVAIRQDDENMRLADALQQFIER